MMPGACTGACYSRGCNCYKLEAIHTNWLRRMQQTIQAEIVMCGIERVMELEGWTRDAQGVLVSPDGRVRVEQ